MKKAKKKGSSSVKVQGGGGNKVLAHRQHPFASGVFKSKKKKTR